MLFCVKRYVDFFLNILLFLNKSRGEQTLKRHFAFIPTHLGFHTTQKTRRHSYVALDDAVTLNVEYIYSYSVSMVVSNKKRLLAWQKL